MWWQTYKCVSRIPAHAVFDHYDVFGWKWYHTKSRYYSVRTFLQYGKEETIIRCYVRR